MNRNLLGFLSATALLLAAPFAAAEDNDTLVAAVKSGKAGVNVRARYERVDQALSLFERALELGY